MQSDDASSLETRRQLRRGATRALFAASVLFAPVPFWMLFVGGLVPLVSIAVYFIVELVGSLAQGGEAVVIFAGIFAAHVVVDSLLLYLLSALVCGVLFRLLPTRAAVYAVYPLIVGELAASFSPIYMLVGEHNTDMFNIWSVWHSLWR
jgi:hypothetical protein